MNNHDLPGIHLGVKRIKVNRREFKGVRNNYNGGISRYMKLYKKFLSLSNAITYNKTQRTYINITTLLQCIFKPILWVFHSKTSYHVKYEEHNGELYNVEFSKKNIVYYFLRVFPIWFYKTNKLNKADWEYIRS